MESGIGCRIRRFGRRSAVFVAVVALGATTLTACGGDESAQGDYCAAGEALESSLASLGDLDLVAVGTDGLRDAVAQVRDDLADVRSTASEAAADDVDVLDESIAALDDAISNLGGELTSENASSVGTAIQDVRGAARGVLDTLADC